MKLRYPVILIGLAISAFFPAYLWYQPEQARVGYVFTIGFALASYIPWIQHNSKWYLTLLVVALWWLVIETIGISTCFPYWCFWYSEQLGPKILWWAPRLLLATYPPLVIWVYQYVKKIFESWRKLRIAWGVWLTLVDVILDPIAVQMWLRSYDWWWFWFGVPLSNFMWWILSWTIAIMLIDIITKKEYNKEKNYRWWLWLNLSFFIWYTIWKFILW